jgi:hypothetical protein
MKTDPPGGEPGKGKELTAAELVAAEEELEKQGIDPNADPDDEGGAGEGEGEGAGKTAATEKKPGAKERKIEGAGEELDKEVPVKKKRLDDLLQDRHTLRRLRAAIADRAAGLKGEEGKEKEGEAGGARGRASEPKPFEAEEKAVAAAEQALEEADAAYDAATKDFDAEEQAEARKKQRAATSLMVDAKADLKIAKQRKTDEAVRGEGGYRQTLQAADQEHKEARESLWREDEERIASLADPEISLDATSEFRRDVDAQINRWIAERNPILLRPRALRHAVELVAEERGLDLPEAKAKGGSAAAGASARGREIERRGTGVIAGRSAGSSEMTQEQLLEAFEKLPPSERLRALAEAEEKEEDRKRRPRA